MIDFILIVAFLAAAYFFYRQLKNSLNIKEKPMTVQDIIGKHAKVSKNGIIQNGSMYRAVIEVTQTNNNTNSVIENTRVWVNFRSLLNTLGIPYTFRVQSKYLDIKDHSQEFTQRFEENDFLTPELKELGRLIVQHYNTSDMKETRDYRCFVILHFDPLSDSIDSGVQTGVSFIDDLIKSVSNTNQKLDDEELDNLAQQILDEATQFVFSFCEQVGLHYRRLDREGVYDMVYEFLQKELSSVARLRDAVEAESFTAHIESLTPKIFAFNQQEKREGA